MKNTDYIIYMTTKRGRTWKWLKDEAGWKQVGPEGQTHHPTAEQVLNHLLPACAGIKPITLKVVYRPHERTGSHKEGIGKNGRMSKPVSRRPSLGAR